jgi:hypothetical protein
MGNLIDTARLVLGSNVSQEYILAVLQTPSLLGSCIMAEPRMKDPSAVE